jgi:SAM-dependent methyltransferase
MQPVSLTELPEPQRLDAWRRLRAAWTVLDVRSARAKPFRCPLCGPSVLLRLADDELAVRCLKCGATPIAMSVASVLQARFPALATATVYELSARGSLHRFLRRRSKSLVCSQYVEGASPGSEVAGVRVEDVQRLTFASCSFDVCSSTEVFEHVPDDRQAFREALRVLKPGGMLVFSVPIDLDANTFERARLVDGELVHLAPPEHHRDPASTHAPVLAYRNYGIDIVARLNEAGFSEAEIALPSEAPWFGCRRPVIVALK